MDLSSKRHTTATVGTLGECNVGSTCTLLLPSCPCGLYHQNRQEKQQETRSSGNRQVSTCGCQASHQQHDLVKLWLHDAKQAITSICLVRLKLNCEVSKPSSPQLPKTFVTASATAEKEQPKSYQRGCLDLCCRSLDCVVCQLGFRPIWLPQPPQSQQGKLVVR